MTRRAAILAVLIAASVLGAFALEHLLSSPVRRFGHTQAGHVFGWIGLVAILLVFAYPARKQMRPNQVWSKPGLYLHEILGVLGPLFVLIHSGAHFHAQVPVLALAALGLVVVSGIVGQVLHRVAFRNLYEQRHELTRQGLTEDAIETRVAELASQEGILRWWPWVHVPLTAVFLVLSVIHIGTALYYGGF